MNNATHLIKDIPLNLDINAFAERVKCRRKQQIKKIETLLNTLSDEDGPVVIYKKCSLTSSEVPFFQLDGISFKNKNVSTHLSEVENIFVFMTSCGIHLHEKSMTKTNMFDQFVMMELCKVSGDQARDVLESHIYEKYGLKDGCYFFPGEDGWQLEEGKGIFTLLQPEAAQMKITLNERFMVRPHFSLYGLYCG